MATTTKTTTPSSTPRKRGVKRESTFQLKQDARTAPSDTSRIPVVIHGDIRDRWEGLSTTEAIWGTVPNKRFVSQQLGDETVRAKVADFFVRRQIINVIKSMIPTVMIKPSETAFSVSDYLQAVSSSLGGDTEVAAVVIELTLPTLLSIGMVNGNVKFSRQMSYGFDRVTVREIRHDISMYQVLQEVAKISTKSLNADQKVSKSVFAENLGEAFRPIGLAIFEIVDLGAVIDDIVRGVRANLDPALITGDTLGSVPHDWRNHRVVSELMQNLVFVRAALALPQGYSMSLTTDSWKLDKWAPIVLTALQSSERYMFVSKAEALRHYQLRKVWNLEGRVVSSVLTRSVEAVPVAQAVFAIEDLAQPGAFSIDSVRERIADVIQASYGAARFSTKTGAELIQGNLEYAIEAGWTNARAAYFVDAVGQGAYLADIAALLSDQLYVSILNGTVEIDKTVKAAEDGDSDDYEVNFNPAWWYGVNTTEKSMKVWSGVHLGDRILTSDPSEVLLAHSEFDAKDALPARPQMLSSNAFNTRMIDFDENQIKRVDTRYAFDLSIGSLAARGSFKAVEFASLSSNVNSALVRPFFNEGVVSGLEHAFRLAAGIVDSVEESGDDQWIGDKKADDMVTRFIRERACRELLRIAQQLSPAFRNEVHSMIVERAIVSDQIKGSDAMLYRAKITQKSFGALADITALHFFFVLQGIDTPFFREMMTSEEMKRVAMEMGTDRDNRSGRVG